MILIIKIGRLKWLVQRRTYSPTTPFSIAWPMHALLINVTRAFLHVYSFVKKEIVFYREKNKYNNNINSFRKNINYFVLFQWNYSWLDCNADLSIERQELNFVVDESSMMDTLDPSLCWSTKTLIIGQLIIYFLRILVESRSRDR